MCVRLNGSDDDWTNTGMLEKYRYFIMGNALVMPVVENREVVTGNHIATNNCLGGIA